MIENKCLINTVAAKEIFEEDFRNDPSLKPSNIILEILEKYDERIQKLIGSEYKKIELEALVQDAINSFKTHAFYKSLSENEKVYWDRQVESLFDNIIVKRQKNLLGMVINNEESFSTGATRFENNRKTISAALKPLAAKLEITYDYLQQELIYIFDSKQTDFVINENSIKSQEVVFADKKQMQIWEGLKALPLSDFISVRSFIKSIHIESHYAIMVSKGKVTIKDLGKKRVANYIQREVDNKIKQWEKDENALYKIRDQWNKLIKTRKEALQFMGTIISAYKRNNNVTAEEIKEDRFIDSYVTLEMIEETLNRAKIVDELNKYQKMKDTVSIGYSLFDLYAASEFMQNVFGIDKESMAAYWRDPSSMRKIKYKTIEEINGEKKTVTREKLMTYAEVAESGNAYNDGALVTKSLLYNLLREGIAKCTPFSKLDYFLLDAEMKLNYFNAIKNEAKAAKYRNIVRKIRESFKSLDKVKRLHYDGRIKDEALRINIERTEEDLFKEELEVDGEKVFKEITDEDFKKLKTQDRINKINELKDVLYLRSKETPYSIVVSIQKAISKGREKVHVEGYGIEGERYSAMTNAHHLHTQMSKTQELQNLSEDYNTFYGENQAQIMRYDGLLNLNTGIRQLSKDMPDKDFILSCLIFYVKGIQKDKSKGYFHYIIPFGDKSSSFYVNAPYMDLESETNKEILKNIVSEETRDADQLALKRMVAGYINETNRISPEYIDFVYSHMNDFLDNFYLNNYYLQNHVLGGEDNYQKRGKFSMDDYVKRASSAVSSGIQIPENVEGGLGNTFNHATFTDKILKALGGKIESERLNGMVFTRPSFMQRMAKSLGGRVTREDNDPHFFSTKSLITGMKGDVRLQTKGNFVDVSVLAKNDFLPIYQRIWDYMEKHDIDTLTFESAAKKYDGEAKELFLYDTNSLLDKQTRNITVNGELKEQMFIPNSNLGQNTIVQLNNGTDIATYIVKGSDEKKQSLEKINAFDIDVFLENRGIDTEGMTTNDIVKEIKKYQSDFLDHVQQNKNFHPFTENISEQATQIYNAVKDIYNRNIAPQNIVNATPDVRQYPSECLYLIQDLRHEVNAKPHAVPVQYFPNFMALDEFKEIEDLLIAHSKGNIDALERLTDNFNIQVLQKWAKYLLDVDADAMLLKMVEDPSSMKDPQMTKRLLGKIAGYLNKDALKLNMPRVGLQEIGDVTGLCKGFREAKQYNTSTKQFEDTEYMLLPEIACNIEGIRYAETYNTYNDAIDAITIDKDRYWDYYDENGKIKTWEIEFDNGRWVVGGEYVVATRIPADDLHSHTMARAKRRIKEGNFVMLDMDSQEASGSDFDGDMRYCWIPAKAKNGRLITDNSSFGVSNCVLKVHKKVFEQKKYNERIKRGIDVNCYDEIIKKNIDPSRTLNQNNRYSLLNIADKRTKIIVRRSIIGTMSNISVGYSLACCYGMDVDKDETGELKWHISNLLNMCFDDGKEPKIEKLGLTISTASAFIYDLATYYNKANGRSDQERDYYKVIDILMKRYSNYVANPSTIAKYVDDEKVNYNGFIRKRGSATAKLDKEEKAAIWEFRRKGGILPKAKRFYDSTFSLEVDATTFWAKQMTMIDRFMHKRNQSKAKVLLNKNKEVDDTLNPLINAMLGDNNLLSQARKIISVGKKLYMNDPTLNFLVNGELSNVLDLKSGVILKSPKVSEREKRALKRLNDQDRRDVLNDLRQTIELRNADLKALYDCGQYYLITESLNIESFPKLRHDVISSLLEYHSNNVTDNKFLNLFTVLLSDDKGRSLSQKVSSYRYFNSRYKKGLKNVIDYENQKDRTNKEVSIQDFFSRVLLRFDNPFYSNEVMDETFQEIKEDFAKLPIQTKMLFAAYSLSSEKFNRGNKTDSLYPYFDHETRTAIGQLIENKFKDNLSNWKSLHRFKSWLDNVITYRLNNDNTPITTANYLTQQVYKGVYYSLDVMYQNQIYKYLSKKLTLVNPWINNNIEKQHKAIAASAINYLQVLIEKEFPTLTRTYHSRIVKLVGDQIKASTNAAQQKKIVSDFVTKRYDNYNKFVEKKIKGSPEVESELQQLKEDIKEVKYINYEWTKKILAALNKATFNFCDFTDIKHILDLNHDENTEDLTNIINSFIDLALFVREQWKNKSQKKKDQFIKNTSLFLDQLFDKDKELDQSHNLYKAFISIFFERKLSRMVNYNFFQENKELLDKKEMTEEDYEYFINDIIHNFSMFSTTDKTEFIDRLSKIMPKFKKKIYYDEPELDIGYH